MEKNYVRKFFRRHSLYLEKVKKKVEVQKKKKKFKKKIEV